MTESSDKPRSPAAPGVLQLVVCAGARNDDTSAYLDALRTAYRGGSSGYLAGADDLGELVRELMDPPPDPEADDSSAKMPAERILSAALHTIVVVLISKALIGKPDFVNWINRCALAIRATQDQHRLLILDLDGSMRDFFGMAKGAAWSQAKPVEDLGEYAVRPSVTALVALHRSMEAVSAGSKNLTRPTMSMFVSHAKADGLPLAQALRDLIHALPDFDTFYDARDIPWGSDWARVLEEAVDDSVVIALRSEEYESRAWCQQEMLWADEFASPVVVVDLRQNPIAPPSRLGFQNAVSVRVTDGNLYRVVFVALRQGLRARMHVRMVQWMIDEGYLDEDKVDFVVRHPTMNALRTVCLRNIVKTELTIVYPDPPMLVGEADGAVALVRGHADGFRLTTPLALLGLDGSRS